MTWTTTRAIHAGSTDTTPLLASAPVDSEGARALLQQRISLFARVLIILSLIIQLLARVVSLTDTAVALGTQGTANVHLVVILALGAIWWRTRSGRRSEGELAVLDVACVAVPAGYSLLALWHSDPLLRPNQLHLLGIGHTLVARAVLVPSSGLRTALFGVACWGAIATWTYAYYTRFEPDGVGSPAFKTGTTSAWSAMTLIVSTIASHTIFGLRQRIRETAQLGQYTLLRRLGEGGMGVVYEARHALLRRRTALKILPPSKAGDHSIARFEREVQLTAKLTHPNTIAIYDYGRSPDGVFYYVMEYLDGVDLQALVDQDGPQPPEFVAHILAQVASALAEAHATGLIHRDVKPANIILCKRGGVPCVAKVVDFGLVRSLTPSDNEATLTATMAVVGTPLYISPEAVLKPEGVDARSDLYAIGAVGYFLLTGVAPFDGATAVEIAAHHVHSVPVPPSERLGHAVDAALERILLMCLAKEPSARPAGASELEAMIRMTDAHRAFSPAMAESVWVRCDTLARAREGGASSEKKLLTVEWDRRRS